jgi:hypothetical protein
VSAELAPIDGIEWCPKHQGVRNEDAERCDMFEAFDCPGDWEDEDDTLRRAALNRGQP